MFRLACSAFKHDGVIPRMYAHEGVAGSRNISPGFTWEEPPVSTKSFAFSIVDPHPVAKNWVHWFIIDIPFRARAIAEGASRTSSLPAGCKELKNTYNEMGYGGPEPPRGTGVHPYVATLYALNVPSLGLPADTRLGEFLRALEGKVIEEATLTGLFEQK